MMKFCIAALILAALVALPPAQTPSLEPDAYVGQQGCATCHRKIYESYQHVSMAQTFARIADVPVIEDWTSNNRFSHKRSGQHFVMSRRDGKFFQRRYQLDSGGNEINSFEREIHLAIGSGRKERDYFHLSDAGEITQFPVVWYTEEKAWGIAPGYDNPDHYGFMRKVSYRCVFCHNSYPRLAPGAGRYEFQLSVFPRDLPSGIGCERCHGPGRVHAERASLGDAPEMVRASIVNPAKLNRKQQLDICGQCHLSTTSAPLPASVLKAGREIFSFRPGQPLEDYAAYFDYPDGTGHDDSFELVHQAYRLNKSVCFARSEMTCTTCHDPHRAPENKTAFFNEKCASCHAPADCDLDRASRARNDDNCVACHMPQRRTDDIVHLVMADHYIQRRPPPNLLAPRSEAPEKYYKGTLRFYLPEAKKDLYMALALVRRADVRRGIQLLERTVRIDPPSSPEAFFYLASGYDAIGDQRRAIENYRRAVSIDPDTPEIRYNLGLALLKTGETRQAIEAFETTLRQNPLLADAHVALGTAKAASGDVESIRRHNLEAVRIDPLHITALNNLALLEMQLGRWTQAERFLRETLRIHPQDRTARANLENVQKRSR